MAVKIVVLYDERPSTNDLIRQLQAEGKEVIIFHDKKEMAEWSRKEHCIVGCGNIPIDLIYETIMTAEKFNNTGYVEVMRIGKAADYPNYDDTL